MRNRIENSISMILACACVACALLFLLSGCGTAAGGTIAGDRSASGKASFLGSGNTDDDASSGKPRDTVTDILMPEAPGTTEYHNDDGSISIDMSNTSEGYIMIRDRNDKKVQIQITNPDGEMYPYPLVTGEEYKAFPLTCGDGSYSVKVLENTSGDMYAIGLSEDFSVTLKDEFRPFLYPNQYVDYTEDSDAIGLSRKLSEKSDSDLGFVQNVYNYVVDNIEYDTALAANTPVNYIPDIDKTLSSGKGICFDYASLMTAMLRCQAIPTKLVVGYSGEAYHAWISVYLDEIGWVDNIISFDGTDWTLMDPTLDSTNQDKEAVSEYVGDGTNYTAKYIY